MAWVTATACLFGWTAAAALLSAWVAGCDPLFFLGRPRIYLVSCFGRVYPSRLRLDKQGRRWAYVYPFTKVRRLPLTEVGLIGEDSYIERWAYTRGMADWYAKRAAYSPQNLARNAMNQTA